MTHVTNLPMRYDIINDEWEKKNIHIIRIPDI